jgi:peptidyl-prolyl cis-trans isomerase C
MKHRDCIMKYRRHHGVIIALILLIFVVHTGCSSKEDKSALTAGQGNLTQVPGTTAPPVIPASPSAILIDVDGSKLYQGDVDSEIKNRMAASQDPIPKENIEQVKNEMRKRIVNDFTVRTLITNEVNRLKITATDQEFSDALDRLKKGLPQGMTLEDLLKKHNMTKEKMYDDIRTGIKFNKLVLLQKGANIKPTAKEISNFYEKNKNQFMMPETVHARHILVAKVAGDDDKSKAEKKAKAEKLRKQLLTGANFVEIAKNNSDCPSKSSGGDLGTFAKGQMVKPFEDAAFTQEKNAIGPVVETNFGYHIIQVLERTTAKAVNLDDSVKARISGYLKQQKNQEIMDVLLKNLQSKAKIVVNQNLN